MLNDRSLFIPSPTVDKLHAKISPLGRGAALNNVRRSILLKVCRSRRFLWREICGKNLEPLADISSWPEKGAHEEATFSLSIALHSLSLAQYVLWQLFARPPISRY
jgi:hypothetical protein